MNVIRAREAGFCMGVALALRKLDAAVASAPYGSVATLGAIIHNPQVLEEYARKGVRRLQSVEEAGPGMTVLIRAHGVPREDEELLRGSGVTVVDATCPRVKKAQLAIARATARGAELLLYGDASHPEVRGLVSYAAGPCRIISSLDDARRVGPDDARRFVLAAQTTQDRPLFDVLRKALDADMKERLRVLDTICDATRQRQEETLRLAGQVDVMVVVGGRESGNTRRLADIAASRGVPALHVETVEELEPAFFAGAGVVGLTGGASTPKDLIDAVELWLKRQPGAASPQPS